MDGDESVVILESTVDEIVYITNGGAAKDPQENGDGGTSARHCGIAARPEGDLGTFAGSSGGHTAANGLNTTVGREIGGPSRKRSRLDTEQEGMVVYNGSTVAGKSDDDKQRIDLISNLDASDPQLLTNLSNWKNLLEKAENPEAMAMVVSVRDVRELGEKVEYLMRENECIRSEKTRLAYSVENLEQRSKRLEKELNNEKKVAAEKLQAEKARHEAEERGLRDLIDTQAQDLRRKELTDRLLVEADELGSKASSSNVDASRPSLSGAPPPLKSRKIVLPSHRSDFLRNMSTFAHSPSSRRRQHLKPAAANAAEDDYQDSADDVFRRPNESAAEMLAKRARPQLENKEVQVEPPANPFNFRERLRNWDKHRSLWSIRDIARTWGFRNYERYDAHFGVAKTEPLVEDCLLERCRKATSGKSK